jgi:3'-phosphoadenosine 5'-phosphosulfate (PAPS) 3'-phosphatase
MVYDKLGCENYLESGSIGLKICRIADGSADIFVKDVTIRDWDVAPGELILSRAGGFLLTMSGDPIPYQGLFERRGLIAAGNQEVLSAALNCTRDFLGDNS